MSNLDILLIEDGQNWQEKLADLLQGLGGEEPDIAADFHSALTYIKRNHYDLIVVDLALAANPSGTEVDTKWGWTLLAELSNPQRYPCATLVLTAFDTTDAARKAMRDYDVYAFVGKSEFDNHQFLEMARAAIMDARLKLARAANTRYYRLTISFDESYLLSCALTGPDWHAAYTIQNPRQFDTSDLARRADDLNWRLLQGQADLWRPEANSIGNATYGALASERRILEFLSVARALTRQRLGDLWLQFCGPPIGLGVPFELLRDEGDSLVFKHMVTRKISEVDTSKPGPFHEFLAGLHRKEEKLRILIVGVNSDQQIPSVENEANDLVTSIKLDLDCLNVGIEVELLMNEQATYSDVKKELRDGGYHIFHYAGHGVHDETSPEISGIVLHDGGKIRTLTASDINLLVRDTPLRLVFLSCCLGARVARRAGHDDFYGTLDALARADVPMVLGYRWEVADESTKSFARVFYQMLWRTFSPAEALLYARRSIAMEDLGRDDETWAAPVLLMQNT